MTTYCRQRSERTTKCDVTVVRIDSLHTWSIAVASRRKVAGRMRFEPIGLPSDGQLFTFKTPSAAAKKLQALQDEGYIIPDITIARLESEWMPA